MVCISLCIFGYVFFFFKQKTAYEMRISDWSSDVCSSDLVDDPGKVPIRIAGVPVKMSLTPGAVNRRAPLLGEHTRLRLAEAGVSEDEIELLKIGRASCRERVCQYV